MGDEDDWQWPWQYSFPPFFTLQPHAETKSRQLATWRSLVLDYHCKKKESILNVQEANRSPLFYNASIDRKLNTEFILLILNDLASTKNAAPCDKSKMRWEIYWHTLDEWASIIHNYALNSGLTNTVCTLFELTQVDNVTNEEFYGLDRDVLLKALKVLEAEEKCELIESDEDYDVNKTNWEVPERYQMLSAVGSGAYGQVCSSVDQLTNSRVAIKKLARPFQSAVHAKRTYRELKLLKHMRHENVIGLLNVFYPHNDTTQIYLVTHLMGADLNNIIRTQKLSDDHVQFLVYQILRGLKYIHSAGIIHRDLKPSNIAVNEDCELKILDFGLARPAETEMTGYVATRWYRAPEIMLNWMHYNQTVDIWSVGCIMAELLTGKTLFPGSDHIHQLNLIMEILGTPNDDFMQKITSESARNYIKSLPPMQRKDLRQVFTGANPQAIELLALMLELDSEKRITAEQALSHAYLAQYADPTDEPISPPYDQSFEDMDLTVDKWRELVYQEVVSFVPQQAEEAA